MIADLTNTGFGVARHNNWVVFVPFVIPGERVVARVIRNHSSYSEAELVRVMEPSKERVQPECKVVRCFRA